MPERWIPIDELFRSVEANQLSGTEDSGFGDQESIQQEANTDEIKQTMEQTPNPGPEEE